MNINQHPESIPTNVKPIEKFTFSLGYTEEAKKILNQNLNELRDRLDKLIDRFQVTVQGQQVPVIDKILGLTHNPKELKGLALGLDRISTFITQLDELERKVQVVQLIEDDPNWLATTFADFTQDVDLSLEKLSELSLENDEHA